MALRLEGSWSVLLHGYFVKAAGSEVDTGHGVLGHATLEQPWSGCWSWCGCQSGRTAGAGIRTDQVVPGSSVLGPSYWDCCRLGGDSWDILFQRYLGRTAGIASGTGRSYTTLGLPWWDS